MVLYLDHDDMVTFDSMESIILGYLADNVNYFKLFHTGDVLKDAERYFIFGTYCVNVLNLIVVATARALMLNLTIYQKGPKRNIQIPKHTTHATGKEVHLKFNVTLVIWITTTMKPFSSLINLQRGIQKKW